MSDNDYKGNTPPPYGGNYNGNNNGNNNGNYGGNNYGGNGNNGGNNYGGNGYNGGNNCGNGGYGGNNCGNNNYGGNNYGGYNNYGGMPFNEQEYYGRNDAFASDAMGKSRGVAALLAIFLGGLGVHYFYLGKNTAGIVTLLLSMVSCSIWAVVMLVQGILMLVMTNAEFDRKYVYTQSTFPLF